MTDLRLHRREVRSVLRRKDFVDPFFVGKFSFSPYHACAHGCLNCDGRAERYFVEGEFDRDIVVRVNAARVLDAELARVRERGTVFIGSGVSDAYQHPEGDEQLMRSCAAVLAARGMPVTLLTKSSLPSRDIDIWSEINGRAGFTLMVSLVMTDDAVRRTFEPLAASVADRLALLRLYKERGCAVGVAAMPLLPYLSDSDSALADLAEACSVAGADFALVGGLTLRPGRQKATFLETLRTSNPALVKDYERLYGENRPSGAPVHSYRQDLVRRATAAFARRDIPGVIPHRLYRGRLPLYDEVDVLLQHLSLCYSDHPRATARLRGAVSRYREWLTERRGVLMRSRRMMAAHVEEELRAIADTRRLGGLLGNEKLAEFLRAVILERKAFDPLTRRLD